MDKCSFGRILQSSAHATWFDLSWHSEAWFDIIPSAGTLFCMRHCQGRKLGSVNLITFPTIFQRPLYQFWFFHLIYVCVCDTYSNIKALSTHASVHTIISLSSTFAQTYTYDTDSLALCRTSDQNLSTKGNGRLAPFFFARKCPALFAGAFRPCTSTRGRNKIGVCDIRYVCLYLNSIYINTYKYIYNVYIYLNLYIELCWSFFDAEPETKIYIYI